MLVEARPTVDLEELVKDLRFEFPDAPERALTHYLRRAAAAACREGDLVRQRMAVDTVPGVEAYLLDLVGEVELSSLMGVVDLETGRPVARFPHAPPGLQSGDCVWLVPPDEMRFRTLSRRPRRLEVEASVYPSPGAAAIDRTLAERHLEVLLEGAKSYMYAVGGKPWSSPDLAELCRRNFVRGVNAAKTADLAGRNKGVWRNRNARVM